MTKIFKPFFYLTVILLLGTLLHFSSPKKCRTANAFKAFLDLGISHIEGCVSINYLKNNAKEQFSKNTLLLELSRDFYNTFFKIKGGYKLNLLTNIEKTEPKNFTPEKHKFTQSILSNNNNDHLYLKSDIRIEENDEFTSWKRSHGGNWNTKYSVNDFINLNNVKDLQLIWKHTSIKKKNLKRKWKQNIEINPIMINKNLIFVTPDWKIISLNAVNGYKNWEIQSIFPPGRRGILAEADKILNKNFLYLPIGGKIYKIDAQTGKKHKQFGSSGSVVSNTITAPMIYNNFLVLVRADLKAVHMFDKNTGEDLSLIRLFDNRRNFSGGAPWSGVALDKKNGIVFISTGNPQPSLYGVNREGSNIRSSSLIAVDLKSKKVLWDFQETFHDLWDYDMASPPILHNLRINNKIIEVVIATTKVGNTIILERKTGMPIFNLDYKKVLYKSDIPGEITSSYQLDLKLPEKFHNLEYGIEDISELDINTQEEIKKVLRNSNTGKFFPPSFNKDLIMKGIHGGAEWQGSALDPKNQFLYIPVNNVPWRIKPYMYSTEKIISKKIKNHPGFEIYQNLCSTCHQKNRSGINEQYGEKMIKYIPSLVGLSIVNKENFNEIFNSKMKKYHENLIISSSQKNKIWELFDTWDNELYEKKKIRVEANGAAWSKFLTKDGLPAINPPWGYLAKLDLVTGKILWKSPIGYKTIDGKEKKIGTPNFGGVALNGSNIIFYTGTDDGYAYAINSNDGQIVWEFKMEAAGSAPPTIFEVDGKQYISFVSNGGQYHNYKKRGSTVYTFGIK